jgi:hypothetical protein
MLAGRSQPGLALTCREAVTSPLHRSEGPRNHQGHPQLLGVIHARDAWGERTEMLLTRYFLSVGGVLLALLFVADAVVPKVPAAVADRSDTSTDRSVIRIHSDRKWPERVVFDTNIPTIVPAQTVKAEAVVPLPPPVAADLSAKTRVREAFAQLVSHEPKKPEAKVQRKRKIARSRVAPPVILVAQQPRFGFFNTW